MNKWTEPQHHSKATVSITKPFWLKINAQIMIHGLLHSNIRRRVHNVTARVLELWTLSRFLHTFILVYRLCGSIMEIWFSYFGGTDRGSAYIFSLALGWGGGGGGSYCFWITQGGADNYFELKFSPAPTPTPPAYIRNVASKCIVNWPVCLR